MSSAHGAGVPEDLDAATAKARTATGDSWLLDVREPDEWEAGHSAAAHHIPLGDLQARVDELPTDEHIVVVCRSGHRSSLATQALLRGGFAASNITGGMHAWSEMGGDVVTDDGGPGRVA
ncbi:rhodanese-like domain-containing protein [Clavibacter michiganensis]|uniref:Rhodanese-like domain-containing protein n=1 Tax=Clavibacter michiganensis TaxID=28447 RepID=A0A251XUY8_9MICO|nr:rhodanese-like domain-containing protein [Clavibacter michiganensis]OUE09317.1 Thiosulfate sulfurtransferase GlpE [Clavibacter michiganensis]PPF55189.1 rhodanese-like domain-containing protein [Clavibacter michiganensis]PPF69212.1 rhodanese-like domain-containing protein [Clavibacter michiganensis]